MKIGGVGDNHYGGNQEWYSTRWKRGAGCGPTVVTGIVSYMLRSETGCAINHPEFLAMMEDVWEFVTPTMYGLPTTEHLTERIEKYIAARGFPSGVRGFEISENIPERHSFNAAVEFIIPALAEDIPVAFLCLDNAGETALDDWHWTTLVSLDATDNATAPAMIIDSGRLFEIDLRRWYHGTAKGGGFAAMIR
jgi:hypothetical protein